MIGGKTLTTVNSCLIAGHLQRPGNLQSESRKLTTIKARLERVR
jgi:hypothetical protein